MKAVHFGAGSIGRGFIGDLLFESGYETTFVDVDEQIIKQINETNSYDLYVIEENYRKKTISNVQALSSVNNREEVIMEISQADILTTSVWANNLEKIAPLILEGLKARQQAGKPKLNILACENAMFNSDMLKGFILESDLHISEEIINQIACFPNTTVDRMVIEDTRNDLNVINIGKDFELIVEKEKLAEPSNPPLENVYYTANFQKYIEKKLYIINGGHAWAGYIGYVHGYRIIQDVFQNETIVNEIRETMVECAKLLEQKYDFQLDELLTYIDFAIHRFQTPGVQDTINRVCRSPIRKLHVDDRLVAPAIQCESYQLKNENLLLGIASAFLFRNDADDEAVELEKFIKRNGIRKAITVFTGMEENNSLCQRIEEKYKELKDKFNV
ncbi:mannitol dehydrogenase [Oceanobacillus sp. CFH 90083]|uniref:mannitol dehydrogenase family protein n=1 Tax=Oceanobacillus sp. CFH 90083 TaxID=2592336 RepID=UPI00128C1CA8|nr:mannitol dehydrogenase [Oceanobacillus sp. CFH 90083]